MEKSPLEKLKEKYPRTGFDGLLFFEICSCACMSIKQKKQELKKLEDAKPKDGRLRRRSVEELGLSDEISKLECITVTFAAMCLEACIWDYAACSISQKYMKDYLDKLDFVAKWVVIPQLICGSDITTVRINGTCLLDRLRKLTTARNTLVHPKSRPQPNTLNEVVKAMSRKRDIKSKDAFGLIGLLLGELEKVDKTKWWLFKTPAYRHSMGKLHGR